MSESSKDAVNPPISEATVEAQPAEVENNDVAELVEQLIRAKRLTYNQYQTLSKMVLADGTVDEQERCQINRLFDAIQAGAIRIMD
ncbi:MAG: hypothetical protein AAF821_17455 [Cyanobacteria bacterium P01_D01_bin.156]